MIHTITVPRINANEDEVLLVEVLTAVGDRVAGGDVLFVVESSKSAQDVLADRPGFVRSIGAAAGDSVAVGALLCVLSDNPDEPLGQAAPAKDACAQNADAPYKRQTAKDRLRAKRAARAAPPSKERTAPSVVPILPVEELPWLQAMRVSIRDH